MVTDRLKALRQAMQEQNVQAVIIPTSDFHDTEYVCDYYQARVEFSGFTGSAGTLVVLADKAALWTDGRYFIQAARQLEGSGIELMRSREPGVPEIEEWIADNLKAHDTVAFDGRCITYAEFEKYKKYFAAFDIEMKTDTDFPGLVWTDRPAMPCAQTFPYDEEYTGESAASKMDRVRQQMEKQKADFFITTKIDDIGWLLNLRAGDIPSFPCALSYFILSKDGGTLYIDDSRLDDVSRWQLEDNNIQIRPYNAVYEDAALLEGRVLADPTLTNAQIIVSLQKPVLAQDPIVLMKATKNPVEMEGARRAHIKDGIAVTKFMYWLKKNIGKEPMTEISAAEVLHELRDEQPEFLEESFETISAYGANAAMPHYHPDTENPVVIEPRGLYLVDSGGHYLDGTTDITRTFVMGDLTEEERTLFTRVLQGHIQLAKAKFLKGCRGINLDILAREPLWRDGLNYNHGTGHGVGALSNVHEAPNGVRWQIVPERNDSCVLEEGMITSNEPGVYIENKFGIRHENLMLCRNAFSTEYGDFMEHETLTVVPFDLDGIDPSLMQPDEIAWLNDYHQRIYDVLAPCMNEEEKDWLREATRKISA